MRWRGESHVLRAGKLQRSMVRPPSLNCETNCGASTPSDSIPDLAGRLSGARCGTALVRGATRGPRGGIAGRLRDPACSGVARVRRRIDRAHPRRRHRDPALSTSKIPTIRHIDGGSRWHADCRRVRTRKSPTRVLARTSRLSLADADAERPSSAILRAHEPLGVRPRRLQLQPLHQVEHLRARVLQSSPLAWVAAIDPHRQCSQ